jgi:hypothetical protein
MGINFDDMEASLTSSCIPERLPVKPGNPGNREVIVTRL